MIKQAAFPGCLIYLSRAVLAFSERTNMLFNQLAGRFQPLRM